MIPTNLDFIHSFGSLTDREWLDKLISSVDYHEVDGVVFPAFPSERHQIGTNGSAGEGALKEMYNFYLKIKEIGNKYLPSFGPQSTVLDFGCGWGRTTRFFLRDLYSYNIFGVDVDPTMVNITRGCMQHGNYSVIDPQPPIPFEDGKFDIVYAYSVFSHLAESVQHAWLTEFRRILKPEGLICLTVQPRRFIGFIDSLRNRPERNNWEEMLIKSFGDTQELYAQYDRGEFIYRPNGSGVRTSDFYGDAIVPVRYVQNRWSEYFLIRDFIENEHYAQAVVIMQRD